MIAGVFEKCRTVVGFVIRLSCRGIREIVERSDCIRELLWLVSDVELCERIHGPFIRERWLRRSIETAPAQGCEEHRRWFRAFLVVSSIVFAVMKT